MNQQISSVLPKLIAFYLPQFHPIAENDLWWGKGFTEWINVAKARPQFRGHYQPHLPADLGFYDLRVPEVRSAQAELASQYGIHGFCYYHYWFHGKRLLERPFNEVLNSGAPNYPFCLCWANETWTRAWANQTKDMLIEQKYSTEDTLAHIRWLVQAFADQRYIRIENKPVFLIYRPRHLPNPQQMLDLWRSEAVRLGIGEIFLCAVESNDRKIHEDPSALGFDAAVEFQPNSFNLPPASQLSKLWRHATGKIIHSNSNLVIDYAHFVDFIMNQPKSNYRKFHCVTPSWDNSARRKQFALILNNSTPQKYQHWLDWALQQSQSDPKGEPIVFINGWNEWAEGNHLEPDQKWGHGYLEATLNALKMINAHSEMPS